MGTQPRMTVNSPFGVRVGEYRAFYPRRALFGKFSQFFPNDLAYCLFEIALFLSRVFPQGIIDESLVAPSASLMNLIAKPIQCVGIDSNSYSGLGRSTELVQWRKISVSARHGNGFRRS